MAQKKGQTGNPNGRPKGIPNKSTKNFRDFLSDLIDKNKKTIIKDLKALPGKERLLMLEKFMAYVVPKMSTMELTFDQLTEQQLDLLINELTQKLEQDDNQD